MSNGRNRHYNKNEKTEEPKKETVKNEKILVDEFSGKEQLPEDYETKKETVKIGDKVHEKLVLKKAGSFRYKLIDRKLYRLSRKHYGISKVLCKTFKTRLDAIKYWRNLKGQKKV